MVSQPTLTVADLPKPRTATAYMDNEKRIWLYEPDSRDPLYGMWRVPGGVLARAGNPVLGLALKKMGVTKLRRMAPVRVRSA